MCVTFVMCVWDVFYVCGWGGFFFVCGFWAVSSALGCCVLTGVFVGRMGTTTQFLLNTNLRYYALHFFSKKKNARSKKCYLSRPSSIPLDDPRNVARMLPPNFLTEKNPEGVVCWACALVPLLEEAKTARATNTTMPAVFFFFFTILINHR